MGKQRDTKWDNNQMGRNDNEKRKAQFEMREEETLRRESSKRKKRVTK